MKLFRHAIFSFTLLRLFFTPDHKNLYSYLLLFSKRRNISNLTMLPPNSREHLSEWALSEILKDPDNFDLVMHILIGDDFAERNKKDVSRLEKEAGRAITTLWDTDPIFEKYPHLRGLARNKEFEKNYYAPNKQKTK